MNNHGTAVEVLFYTNTLVFMLGYEVLFID